jgi:hypothetical protein
VQRPDRRTMKPSDAIAYWEHLEGKVADLERKLAEATDVTRAPVRARRSDPSTSQRAAAEHYPKAGKNRHRVLLAIEKLGSATNDEVLVESSVPGAWKRVSELLQGGWIEVCGERDGTLSGKPQQAYRLTAKGREARAREREGMPPVHPTRRDGTPATAPKDLHVPAGLFDSTDAS